MPYLTFGRRKNEAILPGVVLGRRRREAPDERGDVLRAGAVGVDEQRRLGVGGAEDVAAGERGHLERAGG